MADSFAPQLIIAVLQMVLGLGLSMGSVYISLKMFDKLTHNLDEWKEIKRGNLAVGILLGGIIISIAVIIESGVAGITNGIAPGMGVNLIIIGLVIGIINLLISIVAAVFAIAVAIRVLDLITIDLDEMEELKKGNTAVAVMMAAVLVAVSFVIRGAVSGILKVINAVEILKALGL